MAAEKLDTFVENSLTRILLKRIIENLHKMSIKIVYFIENI